MRNITALDVTTDTRVRDRAVGALTALSAAVEATRRTFGASNDPLIAGLVGYLTEAEDALGRAQAELLVGMERSRLS